MIACTCSKALSQHSFASVQDTVMGTESDAVNATCKELARAGDKWMFLRRCRVCDSVWAEACYDRGQVMFYYLFPAPREIDPIRWLDEQAQELPTY